MDDAIFQLLRAVLLTNEKVELDDPQAVFSELKAQTAASLPSYWLRERGILPEWQEYCSRLQARWIRVMHAQQDLLDLLERQDIPCVIIKGAAAAMAYPHPELRTMGDVDILVKRVDQDRAARIMEQAGYELNYDKDPARGHYNYEKDGVSFELHRKLHLLSANDERRLSWFEEGIDRREYRIIGDYRFPVLPGELNGLSLLFHIDQHLREGLGLRQILDWMMWLHESSGDDREKLSVLLRDTGLKRLAETVTVLCQNIFGLEPLIDDPGDLPWKELLALIMEKGNFGRKAGVEGKAAAFALSSTDRGGFFRRLQAGGLSRWPAAKRHRILRPFAWLYQGFRVLFIWLKKGKGTRELLVQRKKGKEQRRLLEDLGLELDRTISFENEVKNL